MCIESNVQKAKAPKHDCAEQAIDTKKRRMIAALIEERK
jgi:hypothetical protein